MASITGRKLAHPTTTKGYPIGKLDGKVAILTGGTAGIGEGITKVFLEEGAKVVFCSRRVERGEKIAEGLRAAGHDVTFVRADMTVSEDIQHLLDVTLETYGKVDILVNKPASCTRCR